MSTPTYILGGHQTDFAKVWSRQGQDLSDMIRETTLGALQASSLDSAAIQSIHVGNAFGELQRQQAHLGAMVAQVVPDLWGVPAMRHEGACASSSLAILSAMAEIEAGRYPCALVLGVKQERGAGGSSAGQHLLESVPRPLERDAGAVQCGWRLECAGPEREDGRAAVALSVRQGRSQGRHQRLVDPLQGLTGGVA